MAMPYEKTKKIVLLCFYCPNFQKIRCNIYRVQDIKRQGNGRKNSFLLMKVEDKKFKSMFTTYIHPIPKRKCARCLRCHFEFTTYRH